MNRIEQFYYNLGKYRGASEVEDMCCGTSTAYLNFMEDIYDLFSGFGKIHQYFLDMLIHNTISEDGEITIDNEQEVVDIIYEYFVYNIQQGDKNE